MAFRISTDPAEIDREKLFRWLKDAYWSQDRPPEVIERSLENSLSFSAWEDLGMVGFARVVTDFATFAWLCDVYVDKDRRGQGISKALMDAIVAHPALQGLRWMLGTRDAHGLYERYGFTQVHEPDRFMMKGFKPRPPRESD